MERGSDKFPPRIDEELDQETEALQTAEPTESRVEGFRKDEELPERGDEEGTPEPEGEDRGADPEGEPPAES
jgi:hypothetical protein